MLVARVTHHFKHLVISGIFRKAALGRIDCLPSTDDAGTHLLEIGPDLVYARLDERRGSPFGDLPPLQGDDFRGRPVAVVANGSDLAL